VKAIIFENDLELALTPRSKEKRVLHIDKYFYKSIRRTKKLIEKTYGVKIKRRRG